ncbi:MAG: threonine synthase [Candidatus Saccharimonadales bacterium]
MTEAAKEPLLVSTGGLAHPVPVSQAILEGYAPDNELYTFSQYPQISYQELKSLSGSSYTQMFTYVAGKLLGGAVPEEVLRASAETAYSRDNFDFDSDNNLRIRRLSEFGLHVVGLSDGPTGAFKDMAMQPFALWVDYLRGQPDNPLSILLSTTGDTGPAALHAFGKLTNTEIIAMLPEGRVSAFQRAQMAEMAGHNGVHVLEVDGDFSYINELHKSADLIFDLASVNSVNIARIIAQVPYYVASYLKIIKSQGLEIGDPVDFSVPSGNFGNALSAIIARKMGLPIRNIIVATNENNTVDTLISTGVFKLSKSMHTDSSAQDVSLPSNLKRYIAMAFGNDPDKIGQVYQRLHEQGSVALSDIGIVDRDLNAGLLSATVTSQQRSDTIKDVYWGTYGAVIIDPHTANGVSAARELGVSDDVPMLAMETAKPYKFGEIIQGVINLSPRKPERFRNLQIYMGRAVLPRIANIDELIDYIKANTKARRRDSQLSKTP